MLEELRQRLQRLERPPGLMDGPAVLPLGAPAVDAVLGGGLMRGALHEIAAASEAHMAAATGFAAGVAALSTSSCPALCRASTPFGSFRKQDVDGRDKPGHDGKHTVWIAEDMTALESGAPYGPGLDGAGLTPERLVTVQVAQRRDLLWAMEEALRCRAVTCVIGEMRHGAPDPVAVRRLSLAAAETGALVLILPAAPADNASTAATRWMVGASPSFVIPGRASARTRNDEESGPRFLIQLLRNRRGPRGQWILEWSAGDGRFTLAAHAQPVAQPPRHRPHRQTAQNVA